MKKFVVSDIHGQDKLFNKLIEFLDTQYDNNYKFYLLGDIIDRGEGGYNIFKILTSTKYKNKIQLIKGNHEQILIDTINISMTLDKQTALELYIHPSNGTKDTFMGVLKEVCLNFENSNVDPTSFVTDKLQCINIWWNLYKENIKAIANEYHLPQKVKIYEVLGLVYDILKEMSDYFEKLSNYLQVDDRYLLVHSGFVNMANDISVISNVSTNIVCEKMEDLKYQNPNVFLYQRLKDANKGIYLPPNSRFCDNIIIAGHTQTYFYHQNSKSNNFDSLFTYKDNQLASVCIDGSAHLANRSYNVYGQLNCLNLEDLSQIIIKNHAPYKVEEIFGNRHEV